MVSADHITFTDDGHAWIVTHGGLGVDLFDALDRPCNDCWPVEETAWRDPCHCIDGRQTFDIEVATGCAEGCPHHACRPRTYRVSVVPGMVLPIVRYSVEANGGPYIVKLSAPKMSGESHCVITPGTEPDGSWQYHSTTTLPSAAAPGMWAVKLKVAS